MINRVKPNDTLKNGAKVIACTEDIILALFNGEYVTWLLDDKGNCHSVHYFGPYFGEASRSYEKRVNDSIG